jgi:hypothetical protein
MTPISKAELQRLLGKRPQIRRFAPLQIKKSGGEFRTDAVMAPTRGLTPAITVPGPKRYWHASLQGIAIAEWNDERPRVPVTWVTWDAWRRLWLGHDAASGKTP